MNGIKGLIALAFGTLSLGVAEFVMMGLLPYIAKDFDVSVATAGHAISAYAFGVMVGALALAFLHKFKLKHIVIALVVVQLVGIVATSFANSFNILLLTRFISGLPHGCFFGVGAIVAQRIATNGKGNSAVAIMVAGMTVANVFGVPLGTALAHSVSWRVVFYLLFFWGLIVLFSVIKWLPDTGKIPPTTFKTQFKFLKTVAPWLVLLATFFGNGGMFCVLSYVSPMLTQFGSLPLSYVSAVMVGIGLSMVFGNLISGHLADKLRSGKVFMYFHIMGVHHDFNGCNWLYHSYWCGFSLSYRFMSLCCRYTTASINSTYSYRWTFNWLCHDPSCFQFWKYVGSFNWRCAIYL